MSLGDAISLARSQGVDLVEVAPNAVPPVCRVVDYGKFRYEQSKKDKESRKHQHANRVKEIQLRPAIDQHDFGVKLSHAIDFLCEDMKVKITLRFRGREMAHKEFGFQVVQKFLEEIAPFGHPDFQPKLVGRGLNVMISPLPKAKRAPNPNQSGKAAELRDQDEDEETPEDESDAEETQNSKSRPGGSKPAPGASEGFVNNPFSSIESQAS
jgi:translation initiation factor IF-3